MYKILFAAASLLAAPAFAQVYPGTTAASAQAGATAPGTRATAGASTTTDTGTSSGTSGNQPLGLADLLKQTQAAGSAPLPANDGAGPTGSLDAKARAKKARAQGH